MIFDQFVACCNEFYACETAFQASQQMKAKAQGAADAVKSTVGAHK